jgi:hypothetical protein
VYTPQQKIAVDEGMLAWRGEKEKKKKKNHHGENGLRIHDRIL